MARRKRNVRVFGGFADEPQERPVVRPLPEPLRQHRAIDAVEEGFDKDPVTPCRTTRCATAKRQPSGSRFALSITFKSPGDMLSAIDAAVMVPS